MRNSILVCSVAALSVACGGGGGDSSSGSTGGSNSSTQKSSLSADNYVDVAQDTLGAPKGLESASGSAPGSTKERKAGAGNWATLGSKVSDRRHALAAQQYGALQTRNSREACTPEYSGGYVSMVSDIKGTALAAGDSFTANYYCTGVNKAMTGELGFLVERMQGSLLSNSYDVQFKFKLNNFSFKEGAETYAGTGGFTIAMKSNGVHNSTVSMQIADLTASKTAEGETVTQTLKDFSTTAVTAPLGTGHSTSTTMAGKITSSRLSDNTVQVSTVQPLVFTNGADIPSSGQLLISTPEGGKVRITAQGTADALLELDANGDGTFENKTTKPWVDLF
jgi:hypothetical protein